MSGRAGARPAGEAGAGLAETRESHTAIVGPLNTAAKAALAAAVSVPPAAAMPYEPGTADENDGALMFPKFIKFDASSQVEVPPSPLVGRTAARARERGRGATRGRGRDGKGLRGVEGRGGVGC